MSNAQGVAATGPRESWVVHNGRGIHHFVHRSASSTVTEEITTSSPPSTIAPRSSPRRRGARMAGGHVKGSIIHSLHKWAMSAAQKRTVYCMTKHGMEGLTSDGDRFSAWGSGHYSIGPLSSIRH